MTGIHSWHFCVQCFSNVLTPQQIFCTSQPQAQLLKIMFGPLCWSLVQVVPHDRKTNTIHHKAELTMHLGDGFYTVIWAHHNKSIFGFSDDDSLDPHILWTPRPGYSEEAAKVIHLPDSVLDGSSLGVPAITIPATLQEVINMKQLLGIVLP